MEDGTLPLVGLYLPPDDFWSVVTGASVSVAASLHFVGQISPHSWEEGRGTTAVQLAPLQQFSAPLD